MPSTPVTLTTSLQLLSDLIATARTANSLPPIPSYAKVRRIIGGGAGTTFVARSPLPTTNYDYRLAENEATPIFGDGNMCSENANQWWLRGESNGDIARIEVDY